MEAIERVGKRVIFCSISIQNEVTNSIAVRVRPEAVTGFAERTSILLYCGRSNGKNLQKPAGNSGVMMFIACKR